MAGHAFIRLTGFGCVLVPFPTSRFDQIAGRAEDLQIARRHEGGTRQVLLHFGGGEPRVALGPQTEKLADVIEILPGPHTPCWRIETSLYAHPWPLAFALEAEDGTRPPSYHLDGPDESLIRLQGPFPKDQRPEPADLAAEGQTVVREGKTVGWPWIELAYFHNDKPWLQRQYLILAWRDGSFALLSTQAPEGQAQLTAAAADEIAAGFHRPRRIV